MTENIDKFDITWDSQVMRLGFVDLIGEGVEIALPVEDMVQLRDALTEAIKLQGLWLCG